VFIGHLLRTIGDQGRDNFSLGEQALLFLLRPSLNQIGAHQMLVTILKRLGLGVRIGASIGVTVALFVLMARCLNSRINYVKAYYAERIHRAYHAIQMEVLHIYHETQFKVLSTHHGIQVEVLYAHRRWLNGTLTLGELIMYLMLLLLGVLLFAVLLFTAAIWRNGRARYALAQYNAAWEHKCHRDIMLAYERELRRERVDRLPRQGLRSVHPHQRPPRLLSSRARGKNAIALRD
jgi:hypothetical protein